MAEEIAAEKPAVESPGKRVAPVDDPTGRRPSFQAAGMDGLEMTVGMEMMQGPMLGEALGEIATLYGVVKQAAVGTVEEAAIGVECQPKQVATPLAKQLEAVRRRVIAPAALLKLDPPNATGGGTAIETIEPSIRAPGQVVGQ